MNKDLLQDTISKSNKPIGDICDHHVVVLTGYRKYDGSTFLEEADGISEVATYFCLDCGSPIILPVTQRFAEIIKFEKMPRIVIKCQRELSLTELNSLRTSYICKGHISNRPYIMLPKKQTDKSERQKM